MTYLLFLIVAAVIIVIVAAISLKSGVKKKTLADRNKQLAIAESALRNVAGGSGNPQLEAQIALDEINSIYNKELTQ